MIYHASSVCRALLKVVGEKKDDWDIKLSGVLFAERTTVQRSTGYTPYKIVFGREATLPFQLEKEPAVAAPDMTDGVVQQLGELSAQLHDKVIENIKTAQESMKKEYRRKHAKVSISYKQGELVLLRNFIRMDRKTNKLTADAWRGPYVLVAISDHGLCTLQCQKSQKILQKKYNVSHLKRYISTGLTKQHCYFTCTPTVAYILVM